MEKILVEKESKGVRLDKFLSSRFPDLSRVFIQSLIEEEKVLVNNKKERASYKVNENDEIIMMETEVKELDILPQDIPLDIIYEDEDVIVINKKQGMVVHPASGVYENTLVNALLFHCKDLSTINGVKRPGIVHRIDKDTSGLLVVAKNDLAHNELSNQLKDKTMNREYIAIVHGVILENKGNINAPIGRDLNNRIKMAVIKDGKDAVTHFDVLERYRNYTLVHCKLETGRTHQIRVHMSYIKHPIASDPLYGPKQTLKGNGQYLHAKKLTFIHPSSKEKMTFECELPDYFTSMIENLRMGKE
ncbi:MAG: RluA family pseudouridine synthase [Bacilli bacterium]|nr:RluA family pseudouridine synthase [Bacilli bacterium]